MEYSYRVVFLYEFILKPFLLLKVLNEEERPLFLQIPITLRLCRAKGKKKSFLSFSESRRSREKQKGDQNGGKIFKSLQNLIEIPFYLFPPFRQNCTKDEINKSDILFKNKNRNRKSNNTNLKGLRNRTESNSKLKNFKKNN